MYRSVIDEEKVVLVFFLRVKNKERFNTTTKELTIRMKKLLNSPIQVYGVEQMTETDRKLLSSKNGMKFYNKIKRYE
jgi:hypothetical protein